MYDYIKCKLYEDKDCISLIAVFQVTKKEIIQIPVECVS